MKLKKLAKCSLATALIFGSVGAVAGCNKDNETTEKTEQEQTYNLYVQYMNAKGDTPLTYEQWLASIKGEKGDKGDKGDPGDDAVTPQIRINPTNNEWEVSTDNGITWTSTGVKATGNDGEDTSYVEYHVIFDYKNFDEIFKEVVEHTTVISTQWIKNLPQVKEEYEDVFLGWFIKGTDKQINNFDFIGDNIMLEARFSKPHHEILDKTAPVINLIGNVIVYLEVNGPQYMEEGAIAIDNVDGDISDEIVITGNVDIHKIGNYYIKYDVVDSRGNQAISVYRQVVVRDTTKPIITLNGNSEIILMYGQSYEELGANAIDAIDGEVEVIIDNGELRTEPGGYFVYYIATDNSGNTERISRKIVILDVNEPIITLIGNQYIYLEVGELPYVEMGATAMDPEEGDISNKIVITGNVDASQIGTYFIHYDVQDESGNIAMRVTRTVIVRDTTVPVITLKGDREIILAYGQSYEELGATAIDSYDGEVDVLIDDSELKSEIGRYAIYYTAMDSSGNIANQVIRYVNIVDSNIPEITLTGEEIIYLEVGELPYVEMGATAMDAEEGDISNKIVITGSVNINEIGNYYIHYDVEDKVGNIAIRKTRTVIVRDTTAPVIFLSGDREVVLNYGEQYVESGAYGMDSFDGAVDVEIDDSELKEEPGTYAIYYNATDKSGNRADPVIRYVTIREVEA